LHKLISTVALLAFASALLAQSPFAGTWKLDPAKTKYTTGQPLKDVTLVIEEKGDDLQIAGTGTNADGSPLSVKYTVPIKGGEGKVQEGPYSAVSSKVVSPNVRVNTFSKDGKFMSSRRTVVSKDGKMLRSTIKGMNLTGQSVAGTDVYNKQ
jgi:hypothetical protein